MMTEQEAPGAAQKFDFSTKIQELWNGKLPLFQVFWLYYFAAIFVLKVLAGMLGFLAGAFGLVQIVWAGFMVKPIWLAADQYKGASHWALAAKAAAVLIGIAVVGDVMARFFG